MTLSPIQTIIIILMVTLATVITRALPFIIFRNNDKKRPFIDYLGKVLPFAAIGLLVVYCLKSTSFMSLGSWLPQLISIVFIVVLHLWKNNVLLSIGGGTILYMVLIQLVF